MWSGRCLLSSLTSADINRENGRFLQRVAEEEEEEIEEEEGVVRQLASREIVFFHQASISHSLSLLMQVHSSFPSQISQASSSHYFLINGCVVHGFHS